MATALVGTAPVLLKKDVEKNEAAKKYLVSAAVKVKSGADELKRDHPQLAMFVRNGYTIYRLTYNTVSPSGEAVVASGALYVPDVKGALPLLNYNHGTIFPSKEKNAPSYINDRDAESGIAKLFAANGYLVVMPDYIGYGTTKNLEHPYGAYHITAKAVKDMLYAVKEFCADKELTLSGKNFFSGWSEGAAVSMATVLDLEKNNDGNFKPTATVLNAGPYYTSAFVDHILDAKDDLKYMKSYVWVLQSYNRLYNISKPPAYYFTEPNAGMLKKEGVEADITNNPGELFTDVFRLSYKAGKETALVNAFKENDLWTGHPGSPVIFCHGDKDDYVPLFNSQEAYDEMKAKGADVQLKIFKGHSHTSSVFNYLQTAFMAFEGKR